MGPLPTSTDLWPQAGPQLCSVLAGKCQHRHCLPPDEVLRGETGQNEADRLPCNEAAHLGWRIRWMDGWIDEGELGHPQSSWHFL